MTDEREAKAADLPAIRAQLAAELFDLACGPDVNTDQLAAILDRYAVATVAARKPKYHVPGPYEIALAFGQALATSGKYETPGAAAYAAWSVVPEFYRGRDWYLTEFAPALYGAIAAGEAAAQLQADEAGTTSAPAEAEQ